MDDGTTAKEEEREENASRSRCILPVRSLRRVYSSQVNSGRFSFGRSKELAPRPGHEARRNRDQDDDDNDLFDVILDTEGRSEDGFEHRIEEWGQRVADKQHADHPTNATEDDVIKKPAI